MDQNTLISTVNDVQLYAQSFQRLLAGRWLNESIIVAAVNDLVPLPNHSFTVLKDMSFQLKRYELDDLIKIYGDDYVRDISGKQILVIPLNEGNHWAVAIVHLECNFVEYYDSYIYKRSPMKLLQLAVNTINRICQTDLEVVVVENIPEQMNSTDCGMYVVKFVEHAITGTNLTFSDEDMPNFRLQLAKKLRSYAVKAEDEIMTDDDDNIVYEDIEDKDDLGDELEVDQLKKKDGCEDMDVLGDELGCEDEKPKTKVKSRNLRIGVLSYEDSLKEKEACPKPFLGVNANGITITYNSDNDWRNMLSLTEILLTINKDRDKAIDILLERLEEDPQIAKDWNSKSYYGNEVISKYHFRWESRKYSAKIRKMLKQSHQIVLENPTPRLLEKVENAMLTPRQAKRQAFWAKKVSFSIMYLFQKCLISHLLWPSVVRF
jgi:sentrin-specific protease 1